MSQSLPLPPVQIKRWGIIDWLGMLGMMRKFLVDNGYTFQEKGHEYKGAEAKIEWSASRNYTWFCRFDIDLYIHFRNLKHVQVVVDGEEKPMVDARMIIEITGKLTLDYKNSFEKTKFHLFLRQVLMNYIWRKKIGGGWGDDLYYFIYRLHRETKIFLGMETPSDSSRYRIT